MLHVAVGILVGVPQEIILTVAMCKAMNEPLRVRYFLELLGKAAAIAGGIRP